MSTTLPAYQQFLKAFPPPVREGDLLSPRQVVRAGIILSKNAFLLTLQWPSAAHRERNAIAIRKELNAMCLNLQRKSK